jgi:hypothetical protein
MRCFELIEPTALSDREIIEMAIAKRITATEAARMLGRGWFYYEWKNCRATEKVSTEDVTNTRDISLAGQAVLGYNPVYCNWDSPIGHWKPWCVPGRPRMYGVEQIAESFKRTLDQNRTLSERIVEVDFSKNWDLSKAKMAAVPEPEPYVPEMVAGVVETPPEQQQAMADLVGRIKSECGLRGLIDAAEIGTWHGDTARAIAAAGANVLCVDHFRGGHDRSRDLAKVEDPKAVFLEKSKNYLDNGRIMLWEMSSAEAASHAAASGRFFDLVLIDADHTYTAALADIQAWWPLIRSGGYMAVHDYRTSAFPGVTQAVREQFGDQIEEYGMVSDPPWGYALIRKTIEN